MKVTKEWFLQSDYDFSTAEYMFEGRRYFYSVFMCHLSIEKALKGLYTFIKNDIPTKTHDLNYFIVKINLKLPLDLENFVSSLNDAGVATRYPETLKSISRLFSKEKTEEILNKTKEVLNCLKKEWKN